MNIASLIATSRAAAQERAIEVTAMNLANMSTPGFQASRVQFADWLSPQPMGGSIPGERQIAYTQDRATWRDTTPGALTQTGNPFDLALPDGDYFTVATAMAAATRSRAASRVPRSARTNPHGPRAPQVRNSAEASRRPSPSQRRRAAGI